MGAFFGATKGTRTLDPRITNALLYQLSHGGIFGVRCWKPSLHFHLDKCLMTLRGDADEAISFR